MGCELGCATSPLARVNHHRLLINFASKASKQLVKYRVYFGSLSRVLDELYVITSCIICMHEPLPYRLMAWSVQTGLDPMVLRW